MKSIRIVTLALPLLGGCQLLNWVALPGMAPDPGVTQPSPAAAALSVPAASENLQLRPDPALAAESVFEREDVRIETRFGDADFRRQQARAVGGDARAAMVVAQMYAEGSNGVPRDERSMVVWLKHASLLENAGASYQLYLYYLARGLDRDAVRYERRALRQGYTLPVRLSNRRG